MTIGERKRKPKVFRKVFRMLNVDSDRYVGIANSSQGKNTLVQVLWGNFGICLSKVCIIIIFRGRSNINK